MLPARLLGIFCILLMQVTLSLCSRNIVLLSHSPVVRDFETTSLTCADISTTLLKTSLSIRRQFTWSGSRTTESSSTRPALNDSGIVDEWTGESTTEAIGAFGCGRGGGSVSAVKMHASGSLVPQDFSRMTVVGSKAVIKMDLAAGSSEGLRKVTWYKDGHILDTIGSSNIWEAEGGRALVIGRVSLDDAGIYMAHHVDEDKMYAVGTVLIVRSCATNKWSNTCSKPCPICLNNGVCSEKNGECLCPPGFHGERCDLICPESHFGSNCEYTCGDLGTENSTCQGIQQCTTIGCFCMNGWTGLDCGTACPEGFYGANCELQCFCANGGTCDQFQGCRCTSEWTGFACRVPVKGERAPPQDTVLQDGDRMPPASPEERSPNITRVEADPSFKVNEGQTVVIQCSVTGEPAPQHGEIKLERKDRTEIAPKKTKMSQVVTTSFFSLEMGSYPGPFWCVAKTSAGKTRKEFNFTIPVLPTAQFPPELISKGPKYLKLKLNSQPFIGDGPIENSLLLLKRTNDEQSFRTYEKNIVNDTATISNLEPYTNYTFRVLLFREGGYTGRGHPGPIAVIQTDCDYPSQGPMIKNIHAQNDTILYLSWRLPPQSVIKGEILGYKIYFRELGTSSPWTKIILSYSSTTSTVLKDLKPLAVYSVKIRLYNCAGDSPDSKEVRVTMGRLQKPTGPNVTFVNQTSRTASFAWMPPTNAKPYTISGYEISLEELGNSSPNGLRVLRNVSELGYNGTSLTPYTRYRFQVRAYNHEGPGNYSEEVVIITDEEAPTMPSKFRISGKTPSQVQLAWDEPIQPNGIIREYIANYATAAGSWMPLTLKGSEKQIEMKNLDEYTKYKFRVRAVTIEPGEWTEVIDAKTMSLKPLAAPQRIDVLSPSPKSVQISWEPPPPSEYVQEIRQYKISFTDDMRQREEHWNAKYVPGEERRFVIDNLRPATVYLIVIAAVTEDVGPFSDRKTIRTLQLGLPPPPRNVHVTNVTSNSAIVRWEVVNGYSITNVRVSVKSVGRLDWDNRVFLAGTGHALLNLLEPGTRYNIEVTAGNHNGESSANPIVDFQTMDESLLGESDIYRILVPILAAVVAALFVIITYCKCRHRCRLDRDSLSPLELDSISQHRASTIGPSYHVGNSRSGTLLSSHSFRSATSRAPSTHSGQLLLPESLILSWENIFFEDITLGEGNFGQVVKAVIQIDDRCVQAAVKLLKDGCSADDRKDFLAELDMMVRIGKHPNIISLLGACEHDSSLYLCTEFAPNGNLLQFLRKSRRTGIDGTYTTLTQDQLLQFALDVCQGMAYLSDKELIHRDLAARNVLLSADLTCNVADFGLSRGEGVYVKKTVARLPIRWMAIESLNYNVYTTKSDVWSFGILLWEIVSLGGTPYYGMSCTELYEKLPMGYRMEQPLNCDAEIYKLMCQCWKDRPYDRPSFSQLCVALKRMIDARSNRNYVNTAIFENFKFSKIDVHEEEED